MDVSHTTAASCSPAPGDRSKITVSCEESLKSDSTPRPATITRLEYIELVTFYTQFLYKACTKRPLNLVVSQDRWSFITGRINMILQRLSDRIHWTGLTEYIELVTFYTQFTYKACTKRPLNWVVSQDRWSFIKGRINMILQRLSDRWWNSNVFGKTSPVL